MPRSRKRIERPQRSFFVLTAGRMCFSLEIDHYSIIMTSAALLVIDVQNDFCPGGALPVPHGDEVIRPINRVVRHAEEKFIFTLFSQCWHPAVTTHFKEHGGKWPPHCIQSTSGAEFHPDLYRPVTISIVRKGMGREEDAYAATEGYLLYQGEYAILEVALRGQRVKKVVLAGLATDYCVLATALELRQLGFEVTVLEDGCRGVELNPGDTAAAIEAMKDAGVVVTTSDQINFEAD